MTDALWPGGPEFIRGGGAFRLGTDAVLLADFASKGRARRACDLGCGAGVVSILLAWNNPALTVDAVEIQPDWAEAARQNARLCRLGDRVRIVDGDLRDESLPLGPGSYDLVVSNPPYYPAGRGKPPAQAAEATARQEHACTLEDVCGTAARLTRWGGRFALVHKPERLAEVIRALSGCALEPKRLRFVMHRPGAVPSLVLVEGRRGGNPGMAVEPPLILTEDDGTDTPEVRRIYRRP